MPESVAHHFKNSFLDISFSMKHEMKLNAKAFVDVKTGHQKYETRLFDEKRRKISVGDTIIFSKLPELNEKILVKVIRIIKAKNFEELFLLFPTKDANWPLNYSNYDCAKDMLKYYSHEDQERYGVVAFEIELIEKND